MRFLLAPVIVFLVVELSTGLPVIKHHEEEKKNEKNEIDVEDHGYKETGDKIMDYDPHLRTKWDEEKRVKLELLRQLYNRERELENGEDLNPFKHHEEGDPAKIHAVEIAEVKKSITKITADLTELDRKRHEIFKEYEMQKKFNEQQKEMGNGELDEEKRKQYHEEMEKLKEKHKKHEPLHHPGSKQQLEEVWEKQDHINQEFDPVAFFNLHDMDGNGVWDQDEVKSLFRKELDKMYQEGMPEDDLYERAEEMERMREHVFKQSDIDRNGLIDYHEFSKQIQEPEKDEGWKGLDEQEIYTQEDYDNYVRYHQQQQQQQQQAAHAAANGVPPHPNSVNYQQLPPSQQHGDPNLQYHQGQVPHPAQYQNQIPQYQQYQGQQVPIQHQQQQMPVYQHIPQQQQQQQQQQQHHQQQQQYQIPPQGVTRDQIPLEQQYQHQVAQQTYQQLQQNIPNQPIVHQQQQQQNQQQIQQSTQNVQPQQQSNNGNLNVQVPPAVQNTQNQAASPQQQQQEQKQPVVNSGGNQNLHVVPVVSTNVNHG